MKITNSLLCGAIAALLLGASDPHHAPPPAAAHPAPATAVTPDQALAALKEGNSRFTSGATEDPRRDQARRCDTFANGQHPIASILSCADSRAPVEFIFDQGIGDLFVIRVAGNVADTDEVGTLEYGVAHLGTPLVVVLGHTKCGAVTAVVEKASVHGCIAELVDNIAPAAEKARLANPHAKGHALVAAAIRQNVWQSIEDMYTRSATLRDAAKAGKVKVVGAVYDLHSGAVDWLGQHPEQEKLLKNAKGGDGHAPKHIGHDDHAPTKAADAGHGGHADSAAPAEGHASVEAPKKDNFLALGGMIGGSAGLSALAIRFMRSRTE